MNIIDYSLKSDIRVQNVETNLFDLFKAQNYINKKNIKKEKNNKSNNFISNKRNRTPIKKKLNTKNAPKSTLNATDNEEVDKDYIKVIKSDIFDYDSNFEYSIQKYSKKYFWKVLIFKKYGGQEKMGIDIINNIKKYNIKNKKKNNESNKTNKNNHSISKNSTKNNTKKIIELNNLNKIPKKENEGKKIKEESLIEEKNLLSSLLKCKELLNETKFLDNLFFNNEFLNDFKIFYPPNFVKIHDNFEIPNEIRQKNCLKLFGILKLVFFNGDNFTLANNVKFLENLANDIDSKMGGDLYQKIIEMIYNRLKKKAIEVKLEKKFENN